MVGLGLDVSRVESMPVVGGMTRFAVRASRIALVRCQPWAGPLAGMMASAEERLYEQEKRFVVPQTRQRSDLRQPFEMTAARRAAIERAAKASRLNLETHVDI